MFSTMSRKSNRVTLNKSAHPRYQWEVSFPDGGKRKIKYFKAKTGKGGADEWIETKRDELEDTGSTHETFTDDERSAVRSFRAAVDELPDHAQGIKLSDAVASFIEGLAIRNKSITCLDVANSLRDELEHAGRSERHLAGIKQRLNRFNAIYGDRMACDITTDIIKDFLIHESPVKSRPHYRQALNQLFNHAITLDAAPSNPVAKIIKQKVAAAETGILKPSEVAALLSASDDDTLPGLAISFFAGVRRAEIERLDWSEVDLAEGFIEITAQNAKTAQRRLIPISENLKAWLLPHVQHEGGVIRTKQIFRKGLEGAREVAKIDHWPHNAGRHSFASYHLAANDDPGKLAMALGHPDPRLLFKHYRQLVTAKSAKIYWSITPAEAENIINIKTA